MKNHATFTNSKTGANLSNFDGTQFDTIFGGKCHFLKRLNVPLNYEYTIKYSGGFYKLLGSFKLSFVGILAADHPKIYNKHYI